MEKEISEKEKEILAEEIQAETTEKFYTESEIELIKKEGEDRYLRLLAEFDNYRKRVTKEKEELRLNTKTQMLSAILDIDSDLALAKKKLGDDEGINLILAKLNSFLKNQGVESIQTEVYDADLHEVISVLEVGEEKIIDVISKGYSINGKAFRYPKIILGK